MANARAVEEVPISSKTRKKTSIFWSTVPENEQFRNVQVPGVALGRFKDVKNNTQSQKYVQVVQKSKSDSAILNTRSDLLTVNKQGKTGHKFAVKPNTLSGKKKDTSSIFKGTASTDQLADMSTLSESSIARRASLKNLNVEDKKRVANLIKELAKTGEERELALTRLQEERVSFEEQLSAVQQEQTALKKEREALKQRLEKGEKLLKKYESELKDAKTEKEEQDKILKKFQAQPQSTQTSPLVQTLGTTTKSPTGDIQPRGITKTLSTQAYVGESESKVSTTRDGRMRWSTPQVPVYSNSLFDVKVSNVEHEQNSEAQSISQEHQRSRMESGGLHELYLREYSLQLRLQEQQIEIQRQQVQLQQQLQLLQQQQQNQQQQPELAQHRQEQQNNRRQQQGLTQQREEEDNEQQHSYQQQPSQEQHVHQQQHQTLEYIRNHSNEDHKHEHQKQEWLKQANKQALHSRENQQQPLDQEPYHQSQSWHQQEPQYLRKQRNENIYTQSSPTQQTNLLQKRTPERKGHHVELKYQADTIPHEHAGHSLWQRHEHDHPKRVVENSRHEHEAVLYGQRSEPQTKERSYTPSGSPTHCHHHRSEHDVEKTQSAEEYQTNRNKGQHGTDSTSVEKHHMSKRKSPRNRMNYAKQVDLNNNEYFQPRSRSQKQQKNRHDTNGNLVHDHYRREYLSEPYSETDDQTDMDHHYSSERPCHCGYYHQYTRQQHATLEYDQPILNHRHSKGIPQHGLKQKSPHGIIENPHQKGEPLPAQVYQQPIRHQHSPDRTNSHHQRLLHDPKRTRVTENRPLLGHHHLHKGEYHHPPDIREEHHGVPHHVTHKHERESEYDAAIYQPTSNKHQPTERRVYTHHQSGSPTSGHQSGSPTSGLLSPQVGMTEHDYLPSDRLQHSRPQTSQDKSKDLLDDYIYNHQAVGLYNAKSNAGYEPRDKSNKHSTKRKIARKGHGNTQIEGDTIEGLESGHLAMPYITSQQIQDEDENPNPGYSLYKPNVPHPTREKSEHPRTSSGHNHSQNSRQRYPNSLVEIVEDLEINSGYEERYSEETEMYSTEEPGYDSDEEESTVLDNIFFLKR